MAFFAVGSPVQAAKIQVSTTVDQSGSGSGCSVREAVTAANGNTPFGGCSKGNGADVILLRAGKRYELSIAGSDDLNALGDLDLTSRISIEPRQRKGRAVIDANGLSRVLEVTPNRKVSLSRVDLRGGAAEDPGDLLQGGGAYVDTGASLSYQRGAIVGNRAGTLTGGTGEGGGIYSLGTLTVDHATVHANTTPLSSSTTNGGGILIALGTATIRSSTISNNFASNVGGGIGIYAAQPRPKLIDSTVVDNSSEYTGAGVYAGDGMVINGSTIAKNEAGPPGSTVDGGGLSIGVYSSLRKVDVTNTTIAGNLATGSGGGVNVDAGSGTLRNVTVADNTADSDSTGTGNYGGVGGNISTLNSIISGNHDLNPVGTAPDCYTASGAGGNLVGDPTGCSFGAQPGIDFIGGAKLAGLHDNGGPTETIALRKGSKAIDHGLKDKSGPLACARRDQRGIKRPQGRRCDIGAYERRSKH